MTKKIYVDTNIILNIIKNEKNIYGTDISRPSNQLFFNSISNNIEYIISDWTLAELRNKIDGNALKTFFALYGKKIKQLSIDKYDIINARKRSTYNYPDALHIVLAEKSKSDYIITRDVNDFRQIGTKIPIKKPYIPYN